MAITQKIKGWLSKPVVRKVTGNLLDDLGPRVRQRIGEDPALALGGLSTFLAWLAGKLPAKFATPVQGVVMALGLVGIKATVTPAAAPKIVVSAPVPGAAAPVKVAVPLVAPAKEHVGAAISDAVAKATGKLGTLVTGTVGKVVPGAAR